MEEKASEPSIQYSAPDDGIIETDISISDDTLMAAIASIKYQANRIPAADGPDPSYTAPNLGSLTAEEFIFLLEATLNFDAKGEYPWGVDDEYTNTFTISRQADGTFDQDDLVDLYDDIFGYIASDLPSDHEVYFTNVWGTELSDDDLDIKLVAHYVPNDEGDLPSISALGVDDDWHAFDGQGRCNNTLNGDAASRLHGLVNWYGTHGWNGNSSSSNGGTKYVCASTAEVPNYINVQTYPSNDFYSNGNLNTWPLTDCNYNLCLYDTDMEDNLVDFFDYTNNDLLINSFSSFRMMYAQYQDDQKPSPFGHPCYTSSSVNTQYRHEVKWNIGETLCTTNLPW